VSTDVTRASTLTNTAVSLQDTVDMDGVPKTQRQKTAIDPVSSQTLRGIDRPDVFVLGLTVAEYQALIAWLCKCRCLRLELGNRRVLRHCPRTRRVDWCRHGGRISGAATRFG
jgi:hypothetical protein